jgi:hypothetical protein
MEEIIDRIQVINNILFKYNFNNYLEIGVRFPEDCFNHIKALNKRSVDPGYENPNNPATYPFTSDDFFTKLDNGYLDLSPDFKWDVIFIDGLHLSYQVEKDVLNSLNHLSEGGVIVLHDCNPFMYEDNYTRLIEDFWGQQWNGTVWKTIYKLKASRSDLNICTLDIDHGIGLIKKGIQNLIPFDNPYFEYRIFQQNIQRNLNILPSDELVNWLKK